MHHLYVFQKTLSIGQSTAMMSNFSFKAMLSKVSGYSQYYHRTIDCCQQCPCIFPFYMWNPYNLLLAILYYTDEKYNVKKLNYKTTRRIKDASKMQRIKDASKMQNVKNGL